MKKTVVHIAILGLVALSLIAGCQQDAEKPGQQPAPTSAPSSTAPSSTPPNLPPPSY